MDFSFNLFDLVSLGGLIATIVASYWKLSTRLAVQETKVSDIERDVLANKREFAEALKLMESKMDRKLDNITDKIEQLIKEVARLQGQR